MNIDGGGTQRRLLLCTVSRTHVGGKVCTVKIVNCKMDSLDLWCGRFSGLFLNSS